MRMEDKGRGWEKEMGMEDKGRGYKRARTEGKGRRMMRMEDKGRWYNRTRRKDSAAMRYTISG